MEVFSWVSDAAVGVLPFALTLFVVIGLLWLLDRVLKARAAKHAGQDFGHQLTMLVLSIIGFVVVLSALPVGETLRGQLLSLFGLIMSAAIALSSTTFIGNMLAGVMLRTVRGFRAGDYLSIESYFGRVSEMGLLHTEIQTEHRELVTLPNLFLATNPYRVVRSSGVIVSAEVSLGYDTSHDEIEEALLKAAQAVNLEDPYVQTKELGDFSVVYCVYGMLREIKKLLTKRSQLRNSMLDHLHDSGIEIVSPTFMNTRGLKDNQRFMARKSGVDLADDSKPSAEDIVFDKADIAETVGELSAKVDLVKNEIAELEKALKEKDVADVEIMNAEIARKQKRIERLTRRIEKIDADSE